MIQELTAGIPYTVDTGEKLVNETFGPNNIRRRKTGNHELMTMAVRNGRLLAGEISLEQNGFVLVEHKTQVSDFFDPRQLESVYYPEVVQLIKRESGATRVVIFDHTLRSGDEAERAEAEEGQGAGEDQIPQGRVQFGKDLGLHALAVGQDLEPSQIDVAKLGPQVGEIVPDFSLSDQNGNLWTRSSIMGPKGAMLVFVRSADW